MLFRHIIKVSKRGVGRKDSHLDKSAPEQLREGYLSRLQRLLRLRRDHQTELNELGLKLLDRSIFATYCDCLDIGEGEAGREILNNAHLRVALSQRS